jgi:antitoxin component YwqK of YwqJK toxin-antitoxin module
LDRLCLGEIEMKVKSPIGTTVGLVTILLGLAAQAQDMPDLMVLPDRSAARMLADKPGELSEPTPARSKRQSWSSTKKGHTPAGAVTPAISRLPGIKVETVTERYPNGTIKVERQVVQDAEANYINHGTYTKYDIDGNVVKTGEFKNGKLRGDWIQHFDKDEGQLLSGEQRKEFTGPFVSKATFTKGELHGPWTIKDRNGQDVIEWHFRHGTRDGKWTWWHSNGQPWLQAHYKNGALDGELLEWDRAGKLVNQSTYIDGRYLAKDVGWYALGQKHFEGAHLKVHNVPEPKYDWWTGTATVESPASTGKDQKHGVWIVWYRNGNKKTEGQYDHDVPTGKFAWWYENGQKQAEGTYESGKKSGAWTTWHPNGLKESLVTYVDGKPIGTWMRWDVKGKLVKMRDFNLRSPEKKGSAARTSTSRQSSRSSSSRR